MTPAPRFAPALLVPVLAAALAAAALPGVPWALFGVVVAAAALRWRRSAHPRDEERPRFWLVFWTLAPCCAATAVPILTEGAGARMGPVLLSVGLLALAAALVSPPTPAGVARALAIAAGLVTGVSVLAPGAFAVAAGLVFLVTVVPALLALPADGRTLSTATDGHVRRLHATGDGPRPALARGLVSLTLLGLALALGGGLHAVLPTASSGAAPRPSSEAPAEADDGRGRAGSLRPDDAITGGGAAPRSGFASLLRTSQLIELTVRVDEGIRGPEPFYLRGMTYDAFDGKAWSRTATADAATVLDAADDGWVDVAPPSPSRPRWRLRVEDVGGRARATALWTLPGTERVLLEDRTRATGLRRCADGALFVARPAAWDAGAVYLTEGPATGRDRTDLWTRRCDASVAPSPAFVALPPEAPAIVALAREVAGDASTPADRAARVEAWLRSPRFAYSRAGLDVDRTRPVADFLLRARTGHCWCFASGMALMMRGLGQPARLAVGYRPGDYLRTAGVWTVRGTDAHAWCEVYYEGVGWIVYDPTPGPARGDGYTAVEGGGGERGDGLLGWFSAHGAGGRALRAAAAAVGATVAAVPWPAWAAVGLVATVLLAGWARRRRAQAALAAAGLAGAGVEGAYLRALAALAGLGLVRKRPETPREYLARSGRAVPEVAPPLRTLTAGHDDERYGGAAPEPARRAAADEAADAVAREVRRRRDA